MARWRGGRTPGSGPTEGDEVQRSLELLDRVLSEFDDLENGNVQGGQEAAAAAAEARSRPQQHQRPPQQPAIPVAAPEVGQGHVSSTPEDESPSLGGHQSEDDGYMSMNGRRAKFVLSFRPVLDESGGGQQGLDLPPAPVPPPDPPPTEMADFPPPPEEAERIISTLLPRVSPGNSAKRSSVRRGREFLSAMTLGAEDRQQHSRVTTATQTTLPKTRHQRPYGWETGTNVQQPFHLQEQFRFGSLPYDGGLQYARFPPPWLQRPLPPRTVPGAIERHREVRRRGGTEGSADGEDSCPPQPVMRTLDELTDDERNNFSDDSLEEMLPPPSTTLASTKRNSIAWEVPLDDMMEDPLYTPGSTKVVGRRRRKSGDHSSSGSIHRLREHDDWPEPPLSTEDEAASPFSDSYYDSSATNEQDDSYNHPLPSKNITPNGTYVIRKGRKKERKPLPQPPEIIEYNSPRSGDLKRCSSTFDNIKSLLKEGLLEGLDDAPPDFAPPAPPTIVRVVSLPSLAPTSEMDMLYQHHHRPSKTDVHRLSRPHELAVTMEEEEELGPYKELSESEVNEEERRLIEQLQRQQLSTSSESMDKPLPPSPKENGSCDDSNGKEHVATIMVEADSCWTTASEMKNENPSVPIVEQKNGDVEHEFPPLPPSPVEEDEDEYSEILHQTPGKSKADTLPEPFYRSLEPPASDPCGSNFLNRPCPPEPPPHNMSSLKTRSMDAGFTRGYRNHGSERREVPSERRTLPSELPGPLRRRTFQKRSAQSPRDETMQTSCSLPETPIFARGCDIPRTPHRRAPDIPSMARTTPRPGGLASVGYRQQHRTGTGHGAGGLSQALVGAELLRLAGGPGRGWYPRHRQQSTRPASIEHLDRLTPGHSTPSPWEARDSRKPLTLPPNLSPKFFHRSPREALRRVTSLLIRKGNSPKEPKKDALSPTRGIPGEGTGEGSRQKRGFFKNFWKRSRHYSLEHQ